MPMQQQPQQPDLSTLSYRITSLEQHVQQLQTELRTYVPARENDLQLQSIRSTVERIEGDVKEARKQVTDLGAKLETQGKEQDQVQIKVLKWAMGIVITILVALLIAHLTHFV
jgi:chromosome segregation ATPase